MEIATPLTVMELAPGVTILPSTWTPSDDGMMTWPAMVVAGVFGVCRGMISLATIMLLSWLMTAAAPAAVTGGSLATIGWSPTEAPEEPMTMFWSPNAIVDSGGAAALKF